MTDIFQTTTTWWTPFHRVANLHSRHILVVAHHQSNVPQYGMLLHIFAHVNADHVAFGTKIGGSQCLATLRLACKRIHAFVMGHNVELGGNMRRDLQPWHSSHKDTLKKHIPVPVVPQNKKLPMGRFGSRNPLRARRIALATELTALACPLMRTVISSSRLPSRFNLSCSNLPKGIDIH